MTYIPRVLAEREHRRHRPLAEIAAATERAQAQAQAQSQERDPHGADAHTPGAKLDAGKGRAGLVLGDFARALEAVVQVGTFGAAKYSDSGWLHVPGGHRRYTDAMLRHWLAEATGEWADAQSGLLHSAHLAWNALARLELDLRAVESGEDP